MAVSQVPGSPFVTGPPSTLAGATKAAKAAAQHWGFPEPSHLRTGMNALFAAGPDVLLRVSRINAPGHAAVELTEVLAAHGIRTPEHLRESPFVVDDHTVFAHRRALEAGHVDWYSVGQMVARLHHIDHRDFPEAYPRPWCGSFPWWALSAVLDEVADVIDVSALRSMRRALQLHGDWESRVGELVVCHGDLHPGNVVQTVDGPVLLDWDLLCVGPPAWDHAPLLTWSGRWGGIVGVYEAFARGTGEWLRGDSVAESLSILRLLAATLMRVRAGRTDPTAWAEADRRLRWWRGEPNAPSWNSA